MADTVNVKGVHELAAGSRRLAGVIDDKAKQRLNTVASREAGVVSGKVPRRSGRLASSVTAEDNLLVMGAGVPYAGWIEYGGSRGRPYVAQGRYVYPSALADAHLAVLAGEQAASDAIGGFSWPSV